MVREGPQFTPEEAALLQKRALDLGLVIEGRLGVPNATLIHPQDILQCAYAAYLGDGVILRLQNVEEHLVDAISTFPDSAFAQRNITREQMRLRYLSLIGYGNYGKGEIAQAIRNARQFLSSEEALEMEIEFAKLMAYELKRTPKLAGNSTISISPNGRVIFFRDIPFYELPQSPQLTVEYGPGVAAVRRIPKELTVSNGREQTVYIEKGMYLSQILGTSGQFHGVNYPRLITKAGGISAATKELLGTGAADRVDLITISMVHAAGQDELNIGIENGYTMLKHGGVFAVQVAHGVKTGEAEGVNVLRKLISAFGQPVRQWHGRYIQSTTGRERKITQAIFIK